MNDTALSDQKDPIHRWALALLLGVIVVKDLLHFPVPMFALAPSEWFKPTLLSGWPLAPATELTMLLAMIGQAVAFGCALLMASGRAVRGSAVILIVIYGNTFIADATLYTNNVWLLLLLLTLVAIEPIRPGQVASVSPRRAGQCLISLIYIVAALSKIDPHWTSGFILRESAFHYGQVYPNLIGWDDPQLFTLMAWATIAVELFVGVGLWFTKLRPFAIVLGILFHVAIEVTMPVRMFSFLMCAAYVLFLETATLRRILDMFWLRTAGRRLLVALAVGVGLALFFRHVLRAYGFPDHGLWTLGVACVPVAGVVYLSTPRSASLIRLPPRVLHPLMILFVAAQCVLALKPVWGGNDRFAWRMFGEVLQLRVELRVSGSGDWERRDLYGATHNWRTDTYKYHWSSWRSEEALLKAYVDWVSVELDQPAQLQVFSRRNGGPEKQATLHSAH